MGDLQGKHVLITGANGGLGLATSIQALQRGAELVLACRTSDKAARAAATAVAAAGVPDTRALAAGGFDMLDPLAIAEAVDALPARPVDVVFLQAGGWVWADGFQTVRRGDVAIERTVFQNVVGAHATLAALGRSGRLARGCRVVIIGGEGARGLPGAIDKPSFPDLASFETYLSGASPTPYVPIDALGVAKLCAGLWTRAMARRTDAIEVVWFTPGLIAGTGGTAGMAAAKEWLLQHVAFPVMVWLGRAQWPAQAAAKCVDCLAGRVGAHGDLLGAPEGQAIGALTDQGPMQPLFDDLALQDALWRTCEAAAGPLELPVRAAS